MTTMTLLTRRDPFTDFDAVIRRAFPPAPTRTVGFRPAAEVSRDGDDALVRVDLPGIDLSTDVTVEVTGNRLVVRGERRDERAGNGDGASLREMRYGSFHRTFTLPEQVTADAVSATYDAGVLSVRVAGAYAGTQPRRITVTPGSADTPLTTTDLVADDSADAGTDASRN